ncbi:hypothetical protein AX16_006921 [Volvariella volvacea WC 439]|nr:hypothetical protein AX16_006921 [Volvariella volvacea WC 439]
MSMDRTAPHTPKIPENVLAPQRHETKDTPETHNAQQGGRNPQLNIRTSPPSSSQSVISLQNGQSTATPSPKPHPPRFDSLPGTERSNPTKSNTLPASISEMPNDPRRNHDDRTLNTLFGRNQTQQAPTLVEGLTAPTSKREKRNSINPGLVLSNLDIANFPARAASPALSPLSASFPTLQNSASGGRDSPLPPSNRSLNHHAPTHTRPQSSVGSIHSFSSLRPASPSPSLQPDRWDAHESRSRSGSYSSYHDPHGDHTVMSGGLSFATQATSPRVQNFDPSQHPSIPQQHRGSGSIEDGAKIRRSFESRFSVTISERSPSSLSRYRTASPSHPTDVPDSVDPDDLIDDDGYYSQPPSVPSKGDLRPSDTEKTTETTSEEDRVTDDAIDALIDRSSESPESTPVERTTRSTFIAPALPPIRFSLNAADFSQLFNSVEGAPPLKALEELANRENGQKGAHTNGVLPTPPGGAIGEGKPALNKPLSAVAPLQPRRSSVDVLSPTTPKRLPAIPSFPAVTVNGVSSNTRNKVSPSAELTLKLVNGDGSSRPVAPKPASATAATSTLSVSTSSTNTAIGSGYPSASNASQITITEPGSSVPTPVQPHPSDIVTMRLREAVTDAKERGAQQLKLDGTFAEAILDALERQQRENADLRNKVDNMKRASKQYMDGLTVAQTEYDKELKARRDAEAEVTRLRVLLSGQAAKLMALSGDSRRQELRQQMTKELHDSLSGLEQDLSKLKVERDMALAEVEELAASKGSAQDAPSNNLGRSLTMRLDNIRVQYQRDLVPLTQQREALNREIAELKAVRDAFLEETTALNARNEELAHLSAVYARRMDSLPESSAANANASANGTPNAASTNASINGRPSTSQPPPVADLGLPRGSMDKPKLPIPQLNIPPASSPQVLTQSLSSSTTISEESLDSRYHKISKAEAESHTPIKKFKWPMAKNNAKEVYNQNAERAAAAALAKGLGGNSGEIRQHNFQQLSILRFARCDHCGDKMWGSQLKCTACSTSVHVRCIAHVTSACTNSGSQKDDNHVLPPSMFGRDLIEQVRADSKDGDRFVPVIVQKCIEAVEALALEYEGIYRKTGGLGQSKTITQLFEKGDYAAFDLRDTNRFNDICSVTSVLKTYFRSLPIPLLTYELHEDFMQAVHVRDPVIRHNTLMELVNKLPTEHYHTLRLLMLHLYNVRERSEKNLMNARNLGVVFGPTLMRSRDPGAEFSDMAGKALSVEWMVDNAPEIFQTVPPQHLPPDPSLS